MAGATDDAFAKGAAVGVGAAGQALGVPAPIGAAVGDKLAPLVSGLKDKLLGGGGGNPDSAFSVGRQTIRQTKLLAAKRWDDADRASELFFSTGRGVEEKKRYRPGQPWNLPGGVKNYSAVAHYGGHQKLPPLSDAEIIALAPGGMFVPKSPPPARGASGVTGPAKDYLAPVSAVPNGAEVVPGSASASPVPLLIAGAAVVAVKVMV